MEKEVTQEIAFETIVSNAIKIPGVKVDRQKFLAETLVNETCDIEKVLQEGPIVAGIGEERLGKVAYKLILDRTTKSSFASFAMGIPGGIAMMATIPTDVLQFYGMTLKLAQELIYLYGGQDIWKDGNVDDEMVRNQLILYCGVMFGVAGATSAVRLLSTQVAKTALKKLPQKALSKTFWYPIIKQIGKSIGLKITKKTLANGVAKVVPVIGGIVSGAMTFMSMKPMAERLLISLNNANFHYDEEEVHKDIQIIDAMGGIVDVEIPEKKSLLESTKTKLSGLFKKKK